MDIWEWDQYRIEAHHSKGGKILLILFHSTPPVEIHIRTILAIDKREFSLWRGVRSLFTSSIDEAMISLKHSARKDRAARKQEFKQLLDIQNRF